MTLLCKWNLVPKFPMSDAAVEPLRGRLTAVGTALKGLREIVLFFRRLTKPLQRHATAVSSLRRNQLSGGGLTSRKEGSTTACDSGTKRGNYRLSCGSATILSIPFARSRRWKAKK